MDFIDEFIQEYKNNPCLWKADSAHFKNRTKRQEAYLKLIDVAARHGEHYNVERTKQKINNLRCAFRHQLKKYNEFKSKGEKDEPYCPKRRYFESLMFLKDEETLDKSRLSELSSTEAKDGYCKDIIVENIPATPTSYNIEQKHVEERVPTSQESVRSVRNRVLVNSVKILKLDDDKESLTEAEFLPNIANNNIETQVFETDAREFITMTKSTNRNHNLNSNRTNNCRKRSSSLSSQHSNETENAKSLKVDFTASDFEKLLTLAHKGVENNVDDHYSNFGKVIAYKLRNMEATQAMYAEKLISDVLFQGQMRLLTASRINQFISIDDYKEPNAKK